MFAVLLVLVQCSECSAVCALLLMSSLPDAGRECVPYSPVPVWSPPVSQTTRYLVSPLSLCSLTHSCLSADIRLSGHREPSDVPRPLDRLPGAPVPGARGGLHCQPPAPPGVPPTPGRPPVRHLQTPGPLIL